MKEIPEGFLRIIVEHEDFIAELARDEVEFENEARIQELPDNIVVPARNTNLTYEHSNLDPDRDWQVQSQSDELRVIKTRDSFVVQAKKSGKYQIRYKEDSKEKIIDIEFKASDSINIPALSQNPNLQITAVFSSVSLADLKWNISLSWEHDTTVAIPADGYLIFKTQTTNEEILSYIHPETGQDYQNINNTGLLHSFQNNRKRYLDIKVLGDQKVDCSATTTSSGSSGTGASSASTTSTTCQQSFSFEQDNRGGHYNYLVFAYRSSAEGRVYSEKPFIFHQSICDSRDLFITLRAKHSQSGVSADPGKTYTVIDEEDVFIRFPISELKQETIKQRVNTELPSIYPTLPKTSFSAVSDATDPPTDEVENLFWSRFENSNLYYKFKFDDARLPEKGSSISTISMTYPADINSGGSNDTFYNSPVCSLVFQIILFKI